jgi:hypothetical protein
MSIAPSLLSNSASTASTFCSDEGSHGYITPELPCSFKFSSLEEQKMPIKAELSSWEKLSWGPFICTNSGLTDFMEIPISILDDSYKEDVMHDSLPLLERNTDTSQVRESSS